MPMKETDPVIAEVRAIRDRFAVRAGYDVGAIFRRTRKTQNESGREYVKYPRTPVRRGFRRVAGRLSRGSQRTTRLRVARYTQWPLDSVCVQLRTPLCNLIEAHYIAWHTEGGRRRTSEGGRE